MENRKYKDGAIAVRVPLDIKEALQEKATALGMPMSDYIRQHLYALAKGEDEIALKDIDKRISPSAESFSVTVADFVKQTMRGVQKEMFLNGYREAMSLNRAKDKVKQ